MGVGVSGWHLAQAVARTGNMGVVAGTALSTILVRTLQSGDPGGHLRRAVSAFPSPDMAQAILNRYFVEDGRSKGEPFSLTALPSLTFSRKLLELTVVANFAEVFLAKEGHDGLIGINLLEKIQLPTLPSLYGAMLAGVDYVLMGAGIPRAIPGALDCLARGDAAELKIDVLGALPDERFVSSFDPSDFWKATPPELKRPKFLGIVSSTALATTLANKASGRVDGFIIEGPTAGGHNAPPRGSMQLTDDGQPVYGTRDAPDLDKIGALGLPFWMAGSYGRPGRLKEALALGATGVQVGTPFAFCEESGIDPDIKRKALRMSQRGETLVFTDPVASPTGFPLKVLKMEGTLSEDANYRERSRLCDLGYLRSPYRKLDGSVGYRCPGEPVEDYVRKGGKPEDTVGRKCVCNGLLATMGIAQTQKDGTTELPLVTAGDDAARIAEFLSPGNESYTAADVVARLLR